MSSSHVPSTKASYIYKLFFLNNYLRQELVLFSFSMNQEETEIKKLAWSHVARSDKARIKIHFYYQLQFHRLPSQDIKLFASWDSF